MLLTELLQRYLSGDSPTAATPRTGLYAPPDVDREYDAWKANCGPCALAAILRRPVASLRDRFLRYPRLAWTNPTHMKEALRSLSVRHQSVKHAPVYGLLFIQVSGPWTEPGVPVATAYRHTHWIGYAKREGDEPLVYDVNAREWLERFEWEAEIMEAILGATPGATGFWGRTAIEVVL